MRKQGLWLLCVVLLCVMIPWSACAQETIAEFSYDNSGAVAEEGIKDNGYGDKDTGYLATSGEGLLFASVNGTDLRKLEWSKDDYDGLGMQAVMTGGNKNPWGNGAYLEVRVSTVGYEAVTFSAQLGATKKGPRDYQLQYSVDGTEFTDVGSVYSLTDNKTLEQAFDQVALPAKAAGQETLYIRIAIASDMLVGGTAGLIGSTGGETAIGTIAVYAVKAAQTTSSTAVTSASDEPTQTTASTVTETDVTQATSDPTSGADVTPTTAVVQAADKASDADATVANAETTTTVKHSNATTAPSAADTGDSGTAAIFAVVCAVSGLAVLLSLQKKRV